MRTTPLLWLAMCCEEWGLFTAVAERTWSALRASRWARPTALRQWILVQPYVDPGALPAARIRPRRSSLCWKP